MTLDERLEALTQTVEIMAGMHRDNENRLAAVMDTMNRMGRIMEAHDIILDQHNERIEKLENPGE
jgi:septal ring factor EnvC (AmiA/AmiB activator)